MAALELQAERRGWDLEIVIEPARSTGSMDRLELQKTLERLDRGEADVSAAAKLDRVSRSVRDFAELLERAKRRGWQVILLDLGIDANRRVRRKQRGKRGSVRAAAHRPTHS